MLHRGRFTVHLWPDTFAWFTRDVDAEEYALFYSERHHISTEVFSPAGKMIGQYVNGVPALQFRGSGREWYPAGPRQGNFK